MRQESRKHVGDDLPHNDVSSVDLINNVISLECNELDSSSSQIVAQLRVKGAERSSELESKEGVCCLVLRKVE